MSSADNQKISDLSLEVGLLKRDYEQLTGITNKLSFSIEKIQEMNANLLRMIALHDQKHDNHLATESELKEDIKELHSRITTVTRELHDKIDTVEKNISERIDALRRELQQHETIDVQRNKVTNILREIDKYKYLIIGGAVAVGWILGNVNLGVLGTLMK